MGDARRTTKRLTPEQEDLLREVNSGIAGQGGTRARAGAHVMTANGPVARPAMFMADPPAIGRPDFLKAVNRALRLIPHADVSKIVQGPTQGVAERLAGSGYSPLQFGQTNLMGQYSLRDKAIGINPDITDEMLQETLIHELTHGRGFGEASADKVGALFGKK